MISSTESDIRLRGHINMKDKYLIGHLETIFYGLVGTLGLTVASAVLCDLSVNSRTPYRERETLENLFCVLPADT